MKKVLLLFVLMLSSVCAVMGQARIKFDKVTHNFGTFYESSPVQKCTFTFTNVGDKPLVINQAMASCGCTVTTYTKAPIKPGEKGVINVTYNGRGKFLGNFSKVINVRCNGVPEMVRLYIKGNMKEADEKNSK